jgi:type IV pilus assembly protein PilN
MRFTINLATKRYINHRAINASLLAAVCLLAILAGINGYVLYDNMVETGKIRTQLDSLSGRYGRGAEAKGFTEQEYKALLENIALANGIIVRKSREWLLIPERLEEVVPDGVALDSVSFDAKEKGLKIAGSARNFGRLRTFVENMEKSAHFRDVLLVNHGDTKDKELKSVNFSITCKGDFL